MLNLAYFELFSPSLSSSSPTAPFNFPATTFYQKFPGVHCLYRADFDLSPAALCQQMKREAAMNSYWVLCWMCKITVILIPVLLSIWAFPKRRWYSCLLHIPFSHIWSLWHSVSLPLFWAQFLNQAAWIQTHGLSPVLAVINDSHEHDWNWNVCLFALGPIGTYGCCAGQKLVCPPCMSSWIKGFLFHCSALTKFSGVSFSIGRAWKWHFPPAALLTVQ